MARLLQFPSVPAPRFHLSMPSEPEFDSGKFCTPSQVLEVYKRLCPASKHRLSRSAAKEREFTEMELLEAEAKAWTDKAGSNPIDLESN